MDVVGGGDCDSGEVAAPILLVASIGSDRCVTGDGRAVVVGCLRAARGIESRAIIIAGFVVFSGRYAITLTRIVVFLTPGHPRVPMPPTFI